MPHHSPAQIFIDHTLRYLRYLQAQTKVAEASVAQPSLQQTDGGDTGVIAEPTIGQTAYPTSSDFQQVDASHDGVDTPLAARTGSSHETEELLTSPFTLPSMTMRNQQRTPRGWGEHNTKHEVYVDADDQQYILDPRRQRRTRPD